MDIVTVTEIIDTHCHLNDTSFAAALPDVIERAKAVGVGQCIVPAYDVESLGRTAELAESWPGILFPAYGLHPWFVSDRDDPERIRPFLLHCNAVAVGEIGLDYTSNVYPAAEVQEQALIRQLDMAEEFNLPVLLHCRKAYDRLYAILKQYRRRLRGVLHSYSGGAEGMGRFLDMGFYISFSGSVTRSNARKYHRTATAVPMECLLLETDAPSIATESTVASAVEPRHVLEVARKIAKIRTASLPEICRQSTENARNLFSRIPRD